MLCIYVCVCVCVYLICVEHDMFVFNAYVYVYVWYSGHMNGMLIFNLFLLCLDIMLNVCVLCFVLVSMVCIWCVGLYYICMLCIVVIFLVSVMFRSYCLLNFILEIYFGLSMFVLLFCLFMLHEYIYLNYMFDSLLF